MSALFAFFDAVSQAFRSFLGAANDFLYSFILIFLLVIAGLIGRATQGRELPAGKAAKGEGWSFYRYDSYAPGRVERQNRRRPHFEKRPEKKEGSK